MRFSKFERGEGCTGDESLIRGHTLGRFGECSVLGSTVVFINRSLVVNMGIPVVSGVVGVVVIVPTNRNTMSRILPSE